MSKILLVEDDNNLREIYEARLQAEGYTIVSAKDGEEALVVAKAEKPDLVISDVMMPKVSGFEMLDILRNTDGLKDIKVIMLTALGQTDDQQRADQLGANRYLVKSQVTLEDIVKVAHDLLEDTPAEAGTPVAEATPANPTPVAVESAAPEVSTPNIEVVAPPAEEPTEPAASTAEPASTPTPPADTAPAVAEAPVTDEPEATAPSEPADSPPVAAHASSVHQSPTAPEPAASSAQSTSQEEASVEAQIEDFVAGATTDATPPIDTKPEIVAPAVEATETSTDEAPTEQPATSTASSDDPTAPEPVASTDTPSDSAVTDAAPAQPADTATDDAAVAKPDTTAADGASDDKLMADAIKTLEADTDTEPKKTTPEPTASPVEASEDKEDAASTSPIIKTAQSAVVPQTVETPNVEIDGTASTATPPSDTSDEDSGGDTAHTKHRKVISPLDTEPKQDIQELLAIEEAKQAVTQGPPPPTAVVAEAEGEAQVAPLAPAETATPAATEFAAEQAAQKAEESTETEAADGTSEEEKVNPSSIAL